MALMIPTPIFVEISKENDLSKRFSPISESTSNKKISDLSKIKKGSSLAKVFSIRGFLTFYDRLYKQTSVFEAMEQ